MTRLKIDYGIDLGTTNSAICRMENGVPTIKKIEVTDDIMPSCVSFNKKKSIIVGTAAYRSLKSDKRKSVKTGNKDSSNTFIEFKRGMGNDVKFHSSNMERDYTPEELSAEVLKALKSYISDENVNAAIITVPAKFTVNQKTATLQAAEKAGFQQCELLQEPVAAAMAYGLNSSEKNGNWMVFDFGGGTFDAALLKEEDGIMQVYDTEGDNYLGGKNLDEALVDNILIPYLSENFAIDDILNDNDKKQALREAMKTYAEEVKNELSFKDHYDLYTDPGDLCEDENGEDINLDLTLTQQQVNDIFIPIFQKAVDICKKLIERNHLCGNQIDKLILVGGPTHSPLIRKMLREQITDNVDFSQDPMTVVAKGAALYASTIDNKNATNEISKQTLKLEVTFEPTSVETTEWVSIKLSDDDNIETTWIELERNDKSWASGRTEINKKGDVVEVHLNEGKANAFKISAFDKQGNHIDCFPEEISIIQGSKIGSAPLPYNIGIAVWDEEKDKNIFTALKGLEKNKPVPAVGVRNGLKTTNKLRPGIASDLIRIPVYQAESNGEGKNATLFEYVADVIVTGEEVNDLIEEDTEINVTLKVDTSEMMTMEMFFPTLDFSIKKKLDTSKKQVASEEEISSSIQGADRTLNNINNGDETERLKNKLDDVRKESQNSNDRKAVLQHLKEVLREIEDLNDGTEWDRIETNIQEGFDRLINANKDLGNAQTSKIIEELREQTDKVIREKDIKAGRTVLKQIEELFFELTKFYQVIHFIKDWNENFDNENWKDRNRARQLVNIGMDKINNNPTYNELLPIAQELINLLPRTNNLPNGILKQ